MASNSGDQLPAPGSGEGLNLTVDDNVLFLLQCLESDVSQTDLWSSMTNSGIPVGNQRELLVELKQSVTATLASGAEVPYAPFTGRNVPVNDAYILLLLLIELGSVTPDLDSVAEANERTRATARMRLHRLKQAIFAVISPESSDDLD